MTPASAKKSFQKRIGQAAEKLNSLTPADGIELMLAFYLEERAERCDLDEDGDMLLLEWGVFDWGDGEFFTFSITRQFIQESDDEQTIRQLALNFGYPPTQPLRKLKEETEWCESPDDVKQFRTFIQNSPAYKKIAKMKPVAVKLESRLAD